MTKYILVTTFEIKDADQLVEVVKTLDLATLPGFTGSLRVACDPVATEVEEWLDAT